MLAYPGGMGEGRFYLEVQWLPVSASDLEGNEVNFRENFRKTACEKRV